MSPIGAVVTQRPSKRAGSWYAEIECLSADNERLVAQLQYAGEIIHHLWRQYAFVQAKTSWQITAESMT